MILFLELPCRISKDKLELLVTEHEISTNKTINTRYDPRNIDGIIVISHSSSITKEAIKLLSGKDILFVSNGDVFAQIIHNESINSNTKLNMVLANIHSSKTKRRKIGFVFCKGVCLGRIHQLRRLNEPRKDPQLEGYINSMQTLEHNLIKCKTIPEMMAYEGNIAKTFYDGIRYLLKDKSQFTQRDRNSGDLFNSLLNAAHGAFRARITKMLIYNGINPGFGFLHYQKDKEHNFLAWDFSEFWIPYIDKLCFIGINENIFTEKSLIRSPNNDNTHWLSKSAWERLYKLLARIDNEQIQSKIDDFKQHLESNKRFSWKLR